MSRHRTQAAGSAWGLVVALLAAACSVEGPAVPGRAEPPVLHGPEVIEGLPEWQPVDGLRVPRDDFGTAVIGDEIWVVGGMTGDRGTRLDTIEVLDTATGRWRLLDARMPEGLASFETVAMEDDIYLFGGLDVRSRPSDFAAVLDTTTGEWRSLPPLPTPRYSHTVTLHDGMVHVIGGEGGGGPVARVDVFDPQAESWSRGAPMPQARGSHDAVVAGDVIYVLGGWLDGEPSDVVQTYEPATGTWATATPLPEPMSRAGMVHLEGLIWASLHESSYVLEVADGTWSEANPMTVPRHGLGHVAVGDRVYGIGGCTESPLRDVRTVDVLDVSQVSLE